MRRQIRGFSLIELLIAIIVLGILAAAIIPNFSGESTKGKVLHSNLAEIGNAMIRMKLDTGCYPKRIDALFIRTVNTSTNNFCGLDTSAQWKGPYTKPFPANSDGAAILDSISAGAIGQIGRVNGGVGVRYYIEASNIPNSIVREAVIVCNGSDNSASASFDTSSCTATIGSGTTEVGSIRVMFDETR